MSVIVALILGFILGWLVEWAVDWFFWRPKNDALTEELAEVKTQLVEVQPDDSQYTSQIAALESNSQQLESDNTQLQAQMAGLETEKGDLLALVADLRMENDAVKGQMDAQLASLKDDLQEIYGVGPVIEGKLNDAGVFKFRQLADLDPDEFRNILGSDTERPVNEEKIIALAALAAHATEDVRGDDLQVIRGVGPVIDGLLNHAGVYTFADLGGLSKEQLEDILGEYIEHLADEADIIHQARVLAGMDSSSQELETHITGLETEKAALLATVADLRSENEMLVSRMETQTAQLKDDLQEIYGVGPVIENKLNDAGVFKYRQLADLDPDEFRNILGPDTERPVNEEKIIALAGLAAGATEDVRGEDLQAIKGVGPVIAGLLHQAGIYTYADLGRLSQEQLEVILGEYIEHLADEADIIEQAQGLAGLESYTIMESQTKPNTRNFDLIKGGILLLLVIILVVAIDRTSNGDDSVASAPTPIGTFSSAVDGTALPGTSPSNLTPGAPALAPPLVNEDGGVTFSGTGAPGTTVEVWANGEKVADVTVSEGGTWVYEASPPPGDYQVVVVARDADGNVLEQSSAIGVTVPEEGSGPPQISTTPPEAGATPGPGDSVEEKAPEIAETTVSETGEVTITGTGEPGSTVVIFENGVEVTTVQVEVDGTFTVTYELTSEEHVVEAQPEGSAPTDGGSSPGDGSSETTQPTPTPTLVPVPPGGMDYIVQPGEWLIDLARKFYGDPARWVDIYVATNTKATLDSSYAFLSDPNFVVAGWKIYIPER